MAKWNAILAIKLSITDFLKSVEELQGVKRYRKLEVVDMILDKKISGEYQPPPNMIG